MAHIMLLKLMIQNPVISIRHQLEIELPIMLYIEFFIPILRRNLFMIHIPVKGIKARTKQFTVLGSYQERYQQIIQIQRGF